MPIMELADFKPTPYSKLRRKKVNIDGKNIIHR